MPSASPTPRRAEAPHKPKKRRGSVLGLLMPGGGGSEPSSPQDASPAEQAVAAQRFERIIKDIVITRTMLGKQVERLADKSTEADATQQLEMLQKDMAAMEKDFRRELAKLPEAERAEYERQLRSAAEVDGPAKPKEPELSKKERKKAEKASFYPFLSIFGPFLSIFWPF